MIWRRLSFGSQSEAGSQFVSRILTVVTMLNIQERDVLEFLTLAYRASRFGTTMPSLLPPRLDPLKAYVQGEKGKLNEKYWQTS